MHDSHRLWIMIAVFLVVIGLLLGMYFTATPDKVGSIIQKKQAEKMQKESGKRPVSSQPAVYEDTTPQQMVQEENALPDESVSPDMPSESSDMPRSDEEMPKPDGMPEE